MRAGAHDQLSRPWAANTDEEIQVDRAVDLKRPLTPGQALFRYLPDIDSIQQPPKVIAACLDDAVHDLIDSRAVQIQDIVVPQGGQNGTMLIEIPVVPFDRIRRGGRFEEAGN